MLTCTVWSTGNSVTSSRDLKKVLPAVALNLPNMMEIEDNILEIRGAFKSYSTAVNILQGFNMTVPRGTIYGLLGASGCGKTTLLNCVAGRILLDAGNIKVNIAGRTKLGYMPQETALHMLFTVSELLMYFGRVFGLSNYTIVTRGRHLLDLMDLPPETFWNRMVVNMSGGQQRRVSLVVTLLHDPELLLLDEPTVGLDPLLCVRLWDYFIEISEVHKKTVIITTHYIEETRRAHMVGMMRCGVLLAEAPPSQLLTKYNCEALEDVFLLLSQKQSNRTDFALTLPSNRKSVIRPFEGGSVWSRYRFQAEIYKNIYTVKRNIPMLLFMMVLPAFMIFIFCVMCDDHLNSVVISSVSHEALPGSCLTPDLNAPPSCQPESRLSCHFLWMVQEKNYKVEEHADYNSAYQSVVDGHARAMMYFDRNYTWALIKRLSLDIDDDVIDPSIINVHMDRADIITANRIEQDLRDSLEDLVTFTSGDCGYNTWATRQIIQFKAPIYGDKNWKFTKTILPSFLIPFVFYICSCLSAAALTSEKTSGFFDRCLVSGVRQIELLLSQLLIQVIMVVGQNVLLLILAYRIYDMPLNGSWWLTVTILGMAEFQGIIYGFLLATVIEAETNISYTCTGTVLFLLSSCGMLWPLEGAHWVVRQTIQYFPVVMAVESYHSVTVRGWGITDKSMVISLLANLGLVAFFICGFFIANKVKR